MGGSIFAKGIRKAFSTRTGPLPVIDGIDLSIRDGEFVAIVGPSGCGKSTLLDILTGFERPDRGEVLVDGQAIDGPSPKRILIPQTASVFPWLAAWRNLMFVQKACPETEKQRLTMHYLKLVGLADFRFAYPQQLSGGMLKRLELARALAVKPDILLMDEAFGSLDALTRIKLRHELLRVLSVERHTVILVTHDVEEALHLADRIIILSPRPTHILRVVDVPFPHPRRIATVALMELKEKVLADLGVESISTETQVTPQEPYPVRP